MTAVEWLIQQIDNEDMGEIPMWVYDFCYNALEMEKEQIKDAFTEGHNVCRCVTDNTDEAKECFEEWFKTYKK